MATGLHPSGALDHRTLSGVPRPMGHSAAGLPLRHRQGAVRGQDSGGREVRQRSSRGHRVYIRHGLWSQTSPRYAPGKRKWIPIEQENTFYTDHSPAVVAQLKELQIEYKIEWTESVKDRRDSAASRGRQSLVSTRLEDDRQQNPVEHRRGHLVFLFYIRLAECGARILSTTATGKATLATGNGEPKQDEQPGLGTRVRQSLPPLDELIESGKVLALNMPAGSNPGAGTSCRSNAQKRLAAIALRRPAQMKEAPDQYFRPAVFICGRIPVVRFGG